MFTGIVQEVGSVCGIEAIGDGIRITVQAPRTAAELSVNDSVSINGVCQTVVRREEDRFAVVAVEETLRKTTLGKLTGAHRVNLELAMRLDSRMGGHLVSGHVDCVGQVVALEELSTSWLMKIRILEQFRRYVVSAGSIAIDGVSLTVASIEGSTVTTSIIPHTKENTIFSEYRPGSDVNLEFDIIGKYVERLMGTGALGGNEQISREHLKSWGYDL